VRILLTGGAGFIGSHLADAFLADGHEICVFDDLSTGRRDNVPDGAELLVGDLRDRGAVRAVVERFRPQAVSHQGAQTSVSVSVREPLRDAETNVLGTLHLIEACVAEGGVERFVFASTGGAIYGEVPGDDRATVDRLPRPLSPYACSKLAAEAYLAFAEVEHGLPTTVLRYANVYGPRQDPHGEAGVVAIFSRRVLAGEPLQVNARRVRGDDGCVRDYVHVDDVVRANRAALAGTLGAPVVHVATGEGTATRTLARAVGAAAGVTPTLRDGDRRPGDVERSVLDPAAFPPAVPLDEGLRRTVDWFRSEGGQSPGV